MMKYKNYTIHYDPPPIPTRSMDWHFYHDDYDGAPQHLYDKPSDLRHGNGSSLDDCKKQIDEQIAESTF